MTNAPRGATIYRTTRETRIHGHLSLDGSGDVRLDTGIDFLDHMLTALAFHAGWDLELEGLEAHARAAERRIRNR